MTNSTCRNTSHELGRCKFHSQFILFTHTHTHTHTHVPDYTPIRVDEAFRDDFWLYLLRIWWEQRYSIQTTWCQKMRMMMSGLSFLVYDPILLFMGGTPQVHIQVTTAKETKMCWIPPSQCTCLHNIAIFDVWAGGKGRSLAHKFYGLPVIFCEFTYAC
jgi:hypothetical protein